jgi:hypothetical protein
MGLGLLALVAFAARGARRRSGGVKSNVSEPNAAPESAASLEAARALFTRAPCACGASIAEDSVQFTKVRLGGQLLHAARADCGDCSQRRHAYFCLPEDVREA